MKITNSGAHIDQMLRQTRWHHAQISLMADMKANMILTLSALLITFSARYLAEAHLKWAALTLIGSCLLTILLATFAVMPKLSKHSSASAAPTNPFFNLLYFGDFVTLTYPEYEKEMENMMNDPSRTYEAQVRELYTLGQFLAHKKYRFVKLAYASFLLGLVASGVVYLMTAN